MDKKTFDTVKAIYNDKRKMLSHYKFRNTDELNRKLDDLVCTELDKPTYEDALAYVSKDMKLEAYEKYVTNEVPESYEALNNHEIGHLVLQHLRDSEKNMDSIAIRFRANWSKIQKYIDFELPENSVAQMPSFEMIKETQTNLLHQFANIAQDFQVNTICIEPDEEDKLRTAIECITMRRALISKKYDEIEKFYNEYAAAQKDNKPLPRFGSGTGCFPKDYEFPDKQNWLVYIDLMLRSPDKFMQNLVKQTSSASREAKADNNSKKGKIKASSINTGKLSEDLSGNFFRDCFGRSQPVASQAKKTKDSSISVEDDWKSTYSIAKGNGHSRYKESARTKDLIEAVKKFVTDNAVVRSNEAFYQDPVYNYNRRKSANVLVPKTRDRSMMKVENVYLLVDCSGSVPSETVNRMVMTVKALASSVGRQSHVVYWDTDLIWSGRMLDNAEDDVYCGGGTDMASGIDYIRKTYMSYDKSGVLFVISDFYDDLDRWNDAIKKGGFSKTYGIRWMNEEDGSLEADAKALLPGMKILSVKV